MNIPSEILPDSTFACGPSQGHPQLRKTALNDIPFERSHRSPDITKGGLIKDAAARTREFFGIDDSYTVIFFLGGATPAMDAVAWNLAKDSISGLRFGAFSQLWGKKIAKFLAPSIKQSFIDCADGEQFPSREVDYQASLILMTPNETSMGIAVPDDYLSKVYEKAGADTLVAWDCTSCAGGRVLPKGKWDVLLFSMQKCFGCPGGTSVLILNEKAVARQKEVAATRQVPYSLELTEAIKRSTEKHQTVNTPCTVNIWLYNEALKWMLANGGEAGMENLVKKHSQAIWDWAAQKEFASPFVKDEAFRSQTTVTLNLDENVVNVDDINKNLAATGKANLADGIKKYSSVPGNVVRISCFPFVDISGSGQIEKLLKTVEYIIENK